MTRRKEQFVVYVVQMIMRRLQDKHAISSNKSSSRHKQQEISITSQPWIDHEVLCLVLSHLKFFSKTLWKFGELGFYVQMFLKMCEDGYSSVVRDKKKDEA